MIAVIGAGAIGGWIAAHCARKSIPILLIGRGAKWLKAIRSHGLRLEGQAFGKGVTLRSGDLQPRIHPQGPPCDAVFVCVKSNDTKAAISGLHSLIKADTAVISLQNGLTHRKAILKAFGKSRTVFGVSFIAVERPSPLRLLHRGGNWIALAPHPGSPPANAAAVEKTRALLVRAGFEVSVEGSEDRLLWTKAVFNAACNPLGALTNRTNGELYRIPALRNLATRALQEAVTAAEASGHPTLRTNVPRVIKKSLLAAPSQPSSMLQDIRAGRLTEIDAIVGPLLRAGKRHRVLTPTLSAFHRFIRRLELEVA